MDNIFNIFLFLCAPISDFRPTSLEKSQELLRLRLYQVYAWGLPLIIAGVAAILDNLPASNDSQYLRPRFGVKGCWFYGRHIYTALASQYLLISLIVKKTNYIFLMFVYMCMCVFKFQATSRFSPISSGRSVCCCSSTFCCSPRLPAN